MIAENSVLNQRYRLDKKIGQGGFAEVFLATDQLLKRPVAVKVLRAELNQDEGFLERFIQEAQVIAVLSHPNILAVHDYGETNNTAYLVIPYIEGGTLFSKLRQERKLTFGQANHYLQQAAAALDYAHRRSIVHRDIKPQNMLLQAEDDYLLLADFGIAKVLSAASAQMSTAIRGTPAYMAPEQLGRKVGLTTDIYALGCVLFQMLTGELPYNGTTEEIITAHLVEPVPSIVQRSQGRLPDALQPIIERALAKKPEERFQSAGELAKAFQALLSGTPYNVKTEIAPAELTMPTVIIAPPPPQTISELTTFTGHSEGVYSVAFSPDGKTLASGSADRSIKLWESGSGKVLATLMGHTRDVVSVAFSPDGKTLISGSGDKSIKLWRVEQKSEWITLNGHTREVVSVAFSPDGFTIASASFDNTIKVWRLMRSKELFTLYGHTRDVIAVAFSPDGKNIASASFDKTVKLWDTASGGEIFTFTDHFDGIFSLAFSPNGKTIASGSADRSIKLWDATAGGKPLTTLIGHGGSVQSVAFSPDGKLLASASGDKTIKIWDVEKIKEITTLKGHAAMVYSVAFSPDGKLLASASTDKSIKLWKVF